MFKLDPQDLQHSLCLRNPGIEHSKAKFPNLRTVLFATDTKQAHLILLPVHWVASCLTSAPIASITCLSVHHCPLGHASCLAVVLRKWRRIRGACIGAGDGEECLEGCVWWCLFMLCGVERGVRTFEEAYHRFVLVVIPLPRRASNKNLTGWSSPGGTQQV